MKAFLSKEQSIANPNYNRWLLPPAALAVHLSIGMAYGFSVFWKPLGNILLDEGGKPLTNCSAGVTTFWGKLQSTGHALFATDCNWSQFDLGWMYTLFFIVLGCSAALWGGWLERVGPRKAGVLAMLCWAGGLFISAIGIYLHQLWLMWLGSGVIGGIGLGLGYISPVSMLIKWFPDKRGVATGLAIMGFGGGAMIGSPLATKLMDIFTQNGIPGVWQTFVVLGIIYSIFMLCGALGYRLPPPNWLPKGWVPKTDTGKMISQNHVHLNKAHHTPQFWLLWIVLCMNVSAGIGIIGTASPMLQELFGGALIGISETYEQIKQNPENLAQIVSIAAGFVGLFSLFNIFGRIAWASSSDKLGRKNTYCIFFGLGFLLYLLAIYAMNAQLLSLFILCMAMIISMYGGGFATIPAYLADMFGTKFVGAIHGRLLTAWSTAGILGPLVVNYLHDIKIEQGVPYAKIYPEIFIFLAGMLLIGGIANLLVRPVSQQHFMTAKELAKLEEGSMNKTVVTSDIETVKHGLVLPMFVWIAILIPLSYGLWNTLKKASVLF